MMHKKESLRFQAVQIIEKSMTHLQHQLLVAHALFAHAQEGPELIERMKSDAMDVFGKRVVLGEDLCGRIAHDAGDEAILGETLRLDETLDRAVAAPAGRHLEHAGLTAVRVQHWTDVETLHEILAAGDVFGQ